MNFDRTRGIRRAVAVACGMSAAATSSIAFAQSPPADEPLEEVVVTGSRIARPNLESAVPVTTVTADELYETGSTSVGDLLNDLPALRSTFSQSNSTRFLGTTGLNLLDLRGLGTQRTLVLVNGRRHVASDILGNAVSPDTNTFPSDLIERIDVVTGGNSAVYGSDAIAGVVNFILKKDFTGLQFRGQGGQTFDSDAGDYYASVLAGTNFWDDKGNIAANFEYAKQEPFFATDRPNLEHQGVFVQVNPDPDGTSSDGIPDRLYYPDVKAVTYSNGGSVLAAAAPGSGFAPCGLAVNIDPDTGERIPYSCPLIFQPNGTPVAQTGDRIGFGPNGNFNGGNGSNDREYELLGILPKLERYSFNVFGNLKISDAFAPYLEAKYVRTNSLLQTQPAFFQGRTIDGDREQPRFDNPYLTDAARTAINDTRAAAGLDPLAGSDQFRLYKNLSDLGGRGEDAKRETTRFVLGLAGKMSDNWNYDVSVNWGQFKEDTRVIGNLDLQRFALAMDAAQGPNGIVCRSQIDPAAAYSYDDSNPVAVARLPTDIADCQPMNPFGEHNISEAARNYVLQDTTSEAKITEFVASASITGDSSAWFSLPAGPIGVAFGLEHRTEDVFFEAEELVSSGLTFYNALPLLDPPKQKVDEVFTEFRVPLLKEKPGADELTLNLAARYADYSGATGGVLAYNGGLEWAPVEGVRLRAGLARAVRAPSLVDLYSEQSQNFADIEDPCSAHNIGGGSPTRAANCAAAGIPATYDWTEVATPEILSGGNPELKEETSDSFTAGIVLQPTFMPGFTFSADYFDIDIDDVITAPDAQQIMDACYDAADLNNQFCALFQRWGAAGGPGFDPATADPSSDPEAPHALVNGTLQQTLLNYASSTARGIDFEVGYNVNLGEAGKLGTRLVYTHMLQRDEFLDPAHPDDPDQVLYELGDPKDAFNWNTDFTMGKLKFGYQMRYLGHMVVDLAENVFSVGGNPPQNADYAEKKYYPTVIYHDIRASYDIKDDMNAYIGVDNLSDKVPPLGLTGVGEGSGIYEVRGRFWYAGFKVGF